jgi:nitrate/nitrite-specific signal transduction histidine kinase
VVHHAPRGGLDAYPPGWAEITDTHVVSLRQLKWTTIIAPLAFLLLVDYVRRTLQIDFLQAWPGDVLIGGVVLFAVLLFSETVFGRIERMQARLAQQNRELLALHEASLDISGELSLERVLQKVVDRAAELIGARYGALSVPTPDGGIEAFITSGITPEERALIGPPPVGHGLLSVVLTEGQHLRLTDLTRDPRSIGFPPQHPVMHALLAVPIVSGGRILGNLYLADKTDEASSTFTQQDEDSLVRFATQAALAIENARLHRRVHDLAIVEERERIAREMHDSLAQVLGYVNTKAQAVRELLKGNNVERASAQVAQLGDAARTAYADVREGILGLRTSLGPQRSFLEALTEYLDRWREQSGIAAELVIEPPDAQLDALNPGAELQLLRILQEALANVRKHAAASSTCVRLIEAPGVIEAVVEDNGRGFELARTRGSSSTEGPHFGLSTMRERAESIGGTLQIASSPGHGTTVVAQIPTRVTSETASPRE